MAKILLCTLFVSAILVASGLSQPTAQVLNGTYAGVDSPAQYRQDFFLGVPYAKPPVGDLRFRKPHSIDETWGGVRDAKEYGPACYGYIRDQNGYPGGVSEDCLTLNIVRPKNEPGPLPVAVWIHGGGFNEGSGNLLRYNLSFIVKNAADIGKPIIGISINYRLQAWGFIASKEVTAEGSTNLGLRDQRLALHWIQENIHAFGGDPEKVTIWGESAGAVSVGLHMLAYGGRDDGLFRAAISQSGGPMGFNAFRDLDYYQPQFDKIVNSVSCNQAMDKLACLRAVPVADLNVALNQTADGFLTDYDFYPTIDGDILRKLSSISLRSGQFVRVPLLIGANADEGTLFQFTRYGSKTPINTDQDFINYLRKRDQGITLSEHDIKTILKLYPDIPSLGSPESTGPNRPTDPNIGYQFKRVSSYTGDFAIISERRLTCEVVANYGVPVYSYRFNTITADIAPLNFGVVHTAEVPFPFYNLNGVGLNPNPFGGVPESYRTLARTMSSMWTAFVHGLDPNAHGLPGCINWPQYDCSHGKNIVFDGDLGPFIEDDDFRKKQILWLESKMSTAYSR